jgi:hypothetical protein
MGPAARDRVADVFDIHRHARAVEAVFDEPARRGRSRRVSDARARKVLVSKSDRAA